MKWVIFIMISAFFISLSQIAAKKSMKKTHAVQFSVIYKIIQVLLLLMLIPFMDFDIPVWTYFLAYFVAIITTAGTMLNAKSIRHLEISAYAPLANTSPIFLLFIAYFFLGEKVGTVQMLGIFLLLMGFYALETAGDASLKSLWKRLSGSRYVIFAILAYIILAFSATGEKYLLESINPLTLIFLILFFSGINYLIISMIFYDGFKDIKTGLKSSGPYIALCAILATVSHFFYMNALDIAYVSLVIPLKRMSTFFTTIFGGKLFHEEDLWQKGAACIVMILGVFLIAL